jgi:hypothetical protein
MLKKPCFYYLLEETSKNFENEILNLPHRKISLSFIGTLRAILDSKFNEFLLNVNSPK